MTEPVKAAAAPVADLLRDNNTRQIALGVLIGLVLAIVYVKMRERRDSE